MKIKFWSKTKNANIKGLIAKSFLFPQKKPNDFYIKKNFAIIKKMFESNETSEAFLYTIMHTFNSNIIDKTLKEEMLKVIIYDYLEQFLPEEKILLLQSIVIKKIKNSIIEN